MSFFQMFNIYIKKAAELYGLPHTRPIYEHAISLLPEAKSRYGSHFFYYLTENYFSEMSLRYAQMERALGEIDRARAIYSHCSEICDPRVSSLLFFLNFPFFFLEGNVYCVNRLAIDCWLVVDVSNSTFRSTVCSGRLGKSLKSNTETRTLSERCCVSRDLYRLLITLM